jgi:hypothetical protein
VLPELMQTGPKKKKKKKDCVGLLLLYVIIATAFIIDYSLFVGTADMERLCGIRVNLFSPVTHLISW